LIANAAITNAKIATAAIGTANIQDAAITNAKIDSLNASKITAGTIDANRLDLSGKLSVGAAASDINSNSTTISGGKITAGTLSVTSADISGQLSFNKLSIESADIISTLADEAIARAKIADDAINESKVEANALTDASISSLNLSNITVTGGISAARITSGTMSADRISGGTLQGMTISGATISAVSVSSVGGVSAGGAVTGSSATFSGVTKGSTFQSSNNSSNVGFGTTSVFLRGGGSTNITAGSTNKSHGHWAPSINNLYDLGTTSLKWDDVRATNSVIQTSDINLKDNVVTTDLGLDFINDLTPIEYTWKAFGGGEEDDETIDPIAGTRTHLGFSAQDIKEKLIIHKGDDQNIAIYTESQYADDFDEENDINEFGLRTSELIPALTKAIQELSTKVDDLTARIEVLEG